MKRMGMMCAPMILMMPLAVGAAQINVKIENLQSAGGFSFTPFWLGVHDGSFDVFDSGQPASSLTGITSIAELGDTAPITSRFSSEQPGGTQTTFAESNGPPVFSPGEMDMTTLDVTSPMTYRYLNYASMVVPSNDLFVGNDDGIMLFDGSGQFAGPIVIDIYGGDVYDNGTEVNDITDGPAFVAGQVGTEGTDETANIRSFFTQAGDETYISSILGVSTPAGDVTTGFGDQTLLGRITITPEPTSLVSLGVLSLFLLRRRRSF